MEAGTIKIIDDFHVENVTNNNNNLVQYNAGDSGDYYMVKSIKIKNFRCFKEIELVNLKRVNLIVGENASGKTSALEACFTVAGGPELGFRLRSWRGLGERYAIPLDWESDETPWQDLFFQFDGSKTIEISLDDSDELSRTVKIYQKHSKEFIVPVNQESTEIERKLPIIFEWYKKGRLLKRIQPVVKNGGVEFKGTPAALKVSFFSTATPLPSQEIARRFSILSKQKRESEIVKVLNKAFPFIDSISIETVGGSPMLYASVKNISPKIPLGLVSSGINKVVALLGAIATQRLVLIDEIENGLFYGKLPDVWEVLYEFGRKYNTQIFASTHSRECLEAAAKIAKKHENDFCLLRTVRETNGCVIRQFTGKSFRQAIEQNIDVR